MSTGTLSRIQIEDIPRKAARGFKAVGQIGNVTTSPTSNGKLQIAIPLTYTMDGQTESREFTARIFVDQEWLTPEFAQRYRAGKLDDKTKKMYDINVSGKLRGLFIGAGLNTGTLDFDQLAGRTVGFSTKQQFNDPSRLEVNYFYSANR